MALRGQPYIPLYVQDFMTDEKLNECSAESTGVYIRIMCLMHKSEQYGTILLKQKDQQNESKIKNFAAKLLKHLPYQVDVIERSLQELVDEGVLIIEGDVLMQKRMVKDGNISETRALSGSKGGEKTKESYFATAKQAANTVAKPIAKCVANSEYEYEDVITTTKGIAKGKFKAPSLEEVALYCHERKNSVNPSAFLAHYEANGWVQGRGKPIKDWKAAVRVWENSGFSKSATTPTQQHQEVRDSEWNLA